MPRITVKSISNEQKYVFYNVLNYVAKPEKCRQGFISATEIMLPPKREMIVSVIKEQTEKLKSFFYKYDNRLGLHVIVEFSPEESKYLSMLQILSIGHYLAQTEFTGCMTYFAVHDHTANPHIDMLVVPINVREGIMYGCSREGWNAIETRLLSYLQNYMPKEAISGFQVAYGKY